MDSPASEIEGPGGRGHAQCQRGQAGGASPPTSDYLFLRQFCIPLLRVTPKIPSVQHAVSPDSNSMIAGYGIESDQPGHCFQPEAAPHLPDVLLQTGLEGVAVPMYCSDTQGHEESQEQHEEVLGRPD